MSENKAIDPAQNEQPAVEREQANVEEFTLRPSTDIHETEQGVTLYMDLPGVNKDALDIDVDQNVLTIKAAINLHTPEDLKPSHMELHSGVFERRFTLGDELASENIEATLKQGELRLFIPRSEQHKPRKIEIRAI
jgi:HSP20 family molecular chaperone IbpA